MEKSTTENFKSESTYKIKICGMKQSANIVEIASLLPDYMGFIFYEKSPRYFDGEIPNIPSSIKKTGVFVDASILEIMRKINLHDLQAIQLHGSESEEFVKLLRKEVGESAEIIKAFAIDKDFDFSCLQDFESNCNYFLFDTKGKSPGGNGEKFDWNLISKYRLNLPFFLSGGIGTEDVEALKIFSEGNDLIYGLDYNSKLEIKAGLKNFEKTKKVLQQSRKNITI